tara:strand:- start:317 stop:508 length:192 start_codon:yes stop_codon:yes gene_type:complete
MLSQAFLNIQQRTGGYQPIQDLYQAVSGRHEYILNKPSIRDLENREIENTGEIAVEFRQKIWP